MRGRRGDLLAAGAALVGAVAIAFLQPTIGAKVGHVRLDDDESALPPPRELRAMTLGYRSAVADLVWAKLLVEYGMRSEQRRTFASLPRFLDAIIELEPDHRTLYQFVDALLFFKPGGVATAADARLSRAYLERGTRERPYDHEVWLHYGQFVAFLAPSILSDEAEIEQWRKDGALAIAHAVELGADADRSLAASSILRKGGDTKANIQHLRRAYALSDNPDTRHQLLLKLQLLQKTEMVEEVEKTVGFVEHEWQTNHPFLTRGAALLVGPRRDPALCAGPHTRGSSTCPANWTEAVDDAAR